MIKAKATLADGRPFAQAPTTGVTMSADAPELVSLSTAISMLHNRDGRVHTFRGGGNVLLGADWNYDGIVDALRRAPRIEVTGAAAQALGHGLVIEESGSLLFIETNPR